MKRIVELMLVVVVLVVSTTAMNAQEVGQPTEESAQTTLLENDGNSSSAVATLPAPNQLRIQRGQNLADQGMKGMIGGGAIALTSTVFYLVASAQWEKDYNPETPEMPLFPLFTVAGYAVGATCALVGLSMFTIGKNMVVRNGGQLITMGEGQTSGSAAIIDLGLGIPPFLSLDAVYGYNYNSNWFVGAGVGGKMWLMGVGGDDHVASLPLYAQVRYTLGDRRIAPYAALSGGYDMVNSATYVGVDFGTRVRSVRSKQSRYGDVVERDNSWWLSSKFGYSADENFFLSIGVAKSF